MSPGELFQEGNLAAAIEAAQEAVKKHPREVSHRHLLLELLLFTGDWDRVDHHLDAIATQSKDLAVHVSILRHLVRASLARQEFYEQGRVPEFFVDVTDVLRSQLQASIAIREQDSDEAKKFLDQTAANYPELRGTCDGVPFEHFRDLDDLVAPCLEIIMPNGNYYWHGFESGLKIELTVPKRPLDFFWQEVSVTLPNGTQLDGHMPGLYAGSSQSEGLVQVGLDTEWDETGVDGIVRGVGGRMFLVGEESKNRWEIQSIVFE